MIQENTYTSEPNAADKNKCNGKHNSWRYKEEEMEENMSKDKGSIDIDYLLENVIGDGGRGQWLIFLVQFPILIVSVIPWLTQMFSAYEPRHRCYIPTCDDSMNTTKNTIHNSFLEFALPKDYKSSEIFKEDENFDPCKMYKKIDNSQPSCDADSFDNSSITKCTEFVYDDSEFIETLTTKFDLVCDEEYKRRFLGTLMMLGLLFGSFIGGWLGDKFGRKITLLVSHIILAPIVTFGGLSPNYETYAALRLISATCLPAMWISGHCLTLEIFGKEYRKSVVMVKDFVFPSGQLILVGIIYATRHWTYIHIWSGVACMLSFPCYFFLPESPRWLATNGKRKQAERVLLNIAKLNGKVLSEDQLNLITDTLMLLEKDAKKTEETRSISMLDMISSNHRTKTLLLLFSWITIVLGEYTLMLNATKLYGSVLINYTLVVTVSDFPGAMILLVTLKYFGRRLNLFYTQFILGKIF